MYPCDAITHSISILYNNICLVTTNQSKKIKTSSITSITCAKYGLPDECCWNDLPTSIILSSVAQTPVLCIKDDQHHKSVFIFQFVRNVFRFVFDDKRWTMVQVPTYTYGADSSSRRRWNNPSLVLCNSHWTAVVERKQTSHHLSFFYYYFF